MPMMVDKLTPGSPDELVNQAISESIAMCIREGKGDQKQCAGMAYGIAREKTGKPLGQGSIK